MKAISPDELPARPARRANEMAGCGEGQTPEESAGDDQAVGFLRWVGGFERDSALSPNPSQQNDRMGKTLGLRSVAPTLRHGGFLD
jgi:hypothetical protein